MLVAHHPPRSILAVAVALACLAAVPLFACGGAPAEPAVPESGHGTSVELAELEIHDNGNDRFVSCPPTGDLGQQWIPPIPAWSRPANAGAPTGLASANAMSPSARTVDATGTSARPDQTMTERAAAETHGPFRSCYLHSLLRDPTQEGHVAFVLRLAADGRVAAVESYAACDLSNEALSCMTDYAARLRFDPPATGSETVVIPSVFLGRGGGTPRSMASNDPYAAAAYVAVEKARPRLHACDRAARTEAAPIEASATIALTVDAQGKVRKQNVDPWTGNKDLLACAANALDTVTFPPPPAGSANVVLRVAFNPRAGSK
ncbi:MAG: hypothetical protein JWM74_738 [Myxococcaceae bacterium]|nr:hypothetical protein [Myxococcaceae bacterium]